MSSFSDRISLRELLEHINPDSLSGIDPSRLLTTRLKLTTDSRSIDEHTVFLAIEGTQVDGHRFIDEVDRKGALLIIGTQPRNAGTSTKAPYLTVENTRKTLAQAAAYLNGQPSLSMKMIGITGTSGKTTSAFLVESILRAAGEKVGLIGTIECRIMGRRRESTHTTPGPIELQALLREMKEAGCTAVVMEVSSHAIAQERSAYIAFDAMGFTNLSPEHLDFHENMQDYFDTKARLFTEYALESISHSKTPVLAINSEDEYGKKLSALANPHFVKTYDTKSLTASISGIDGNIGRAAIHSKLVGSFNRSNIALAATICAGLGASAEAIEKGISNLTAVPGRLESVIASPTQAVQVLVDYAHKPDALEKVLDSIRLIAPNQSIVTVFGCGGDRDRQKRPVMGAIATKKSDRVFVTSDNPRTESPLAIIDEILSGISNRSCVTVIEDRKEAIFEAVRSAPEHAVILIAGKGHEDYQIVGTEKRHFDDREVALDALKRFRR